MAGNDDIDPVLSGVNALPRPDAANPAQFDPAWSGVGALPRPDETYTPPDPTTSIVPANPMQPGAAPVQAPVVPDPTQKVSQSAAVQSSHSGMTSAGLKRSNDLFANVDADTDAQMAGEKADLQGDAKRYAGAAGEQKHAIDELAADTKAHYDNVGKLIDRQNDFLATSAQLEKRAGEQAQLESQQYVTGIKEQLAGVRQLIAQTGDPRSRMSGSQIFGLGLAAAAQGFLAMRGLKIDVTGQIDHWVEQGMADHAEQVKGAQAALQDTFHLYEVARQSSQDQFEARERYKAMVIEGFKGQVQSEAARFGGTVAQANADEATAKLDMEQAQTIDGLQERYRKQRFDMRKAIVDEVKDKGTLAIEKEANQIKWAEVALKRKELDAKKPKEEKIPSYVTDSSQFKVDPKTGKAMSGGKVVGVVNIDNPDAKTAVEETSKAFQMKHLIDTGIDRLKELKPEGQTWSTFMRDKDSEGYRRFDSARRQLLGNVLAAISGKVVTEQEYDRWAKNLQEDKGWQLGSNDGLFDEMKNQTRLHADAVFQSYRDTGAINSVSGPFDARTGVSQEGYQPYSAALDPAGSQLDNAQRKGEKPIPGAVAEQEQGVKTANDDRDVGKGSTSFARYAQSNTDGGETYVYKHGEGSRPELHEPSWAHKMDMIALGAVRPQILKQFHQSIGSMQGGPQGVDEPPEQIAADAYESLRGMSHGEHDEPENVQKYAKHLRELIKDPAQAMKELTGEAP